MRKVVMAAFLTLDGVMQAPGGPEEDTDGGFEYGGWTFPFADEEFGRIVTGTFAEMGGLLLGRRTYDIFAGYWPQHADPDDPVATALNDWPKYVASTTLTEPTWQNTTVLQGDVPEAVRELKEQDGGNLLIQGSSQLVQTLMAHDLVDEYRLITFPVVVGSGKRLFPDGCPARGLRMVESKTTAAGAVYARYELAGEVRTGSY
ncbi:dihydrofolate reductase family protein [Georgenia sp. AZ-5]|uniref:dihydrofolate reductase family protein n=1 Tax=Georgenia sp. AZ-5 TaxID=3367526 RepID=UPI00375450F8